MFSNVWSENTALFERLMEIHSNSPKLYYGFKESKLQSLQVNIVISYKHYVTNYNIYRLLE